MSMVISRVPIGLADSDSLSNIFTESFGAADNSGRYVSRRIPVADIRSILPDRFRKNRDVYQ